MTTGDGRAARPAFEPAPGAEFPPAAFDGLDEVGRREFMKVMAASLALSGLASCGRQPPERIVVPSQPRPDGTHRDAYAFATVLTRGGAALGVIGATRSGRPIRIEGNPDHPSSRGATDIFAQAELLTLYDPDRSAAVRQGNVASTWEAFQADWAAVEGSAEGGTRGRGVRILTGAIISPVVGAELRAFLAERPEARWHCHEPIDEASQREGAAGAFGRPLDLVYDLAAAEVIVCLDADLLYDRPGSVRYARDFAARRRAVFAGSEGDGARRMNRLYVAEPTPTVTGAKADHRLAVRASGVARLAAALAGGLGVAPKGSIDLPEPERRWVEAATADLARAGAAGLVVAGRSQPAAVHVLAAAMNERLGSVGRTVRLIEPVRERGVEGEAPGSLGELVGEMAAGRVRTLLMLGVNPVYTAPGSLGFAEALSRVEQTVHAGVYRDETAVRSRWHLPLAHELESWGDARGHDGTASIMQPLIEPLYGGRSMLEVLLLLRGVEPLPALDRVRQQWQGQSSGDFEGWWRRVLQTGVIPGTESESLDVAVQQDAAGSALDEIAAAGGPSSRPALELVLRPDPSIWDGRYANNAWLQELPKPISKIVWGNAVSLSPATAAHLGVRTDQIVRVSREGGGAVALPVWIQPGQSDGTAVMTLGYGRGRAAGRVADGVGTDAYVLRGTADDWVLLDARVAPTSETDPIVTTQHHAAMETRGGEHDLARTMAAGELAGSAERAGGGPGSERRISLSLYPAWPYDGQQWGMSIDLTSCIGCNSCVIACQAENNIPTVGKAQVALGREMHWIRVDRYYQGSGATPPRILHQPVPCMHCELAPCEVVCPVGATQHSADGLNEMIYNRCIGTRYCSNNCPYKVRRFNFFRYAEHEPPVVQLMRNPDVSVRSRGVMEKCTYCVQRIREADIEARKGNRPIRDGEVVTACQQACPTEAIAFGDVNDPATAVSKRKAAPHDYALLADLNTRPRTTYLAEILNPNPDLEG